METKRVLLLTTGGTIAGNVASDHRLEGVGTVNDFGGLFYSVLEFIKGQFSIKVELEHLEICDIDSSNIVPAHWVTLSEAVKDRYDKYDAFLITHGTNTIGYTAAALSFALANLNKPVILTGTQVPIGLPGGDAIMNLENALRIAVVKIEDEYGIFEYSIKGVLAVFGSNIITGTRVKKSTGFDYDALKSFSSPSIGRIGRTIEISRSNLEKHLRYLYTNGHPPAKRAKDLICDNEFDMRIASLTEFPGMDVGLFQALIDRCDIKAFILRSFGAGDPSESIIEILRMLKNRLIPVVITTQVPNGSSNFQVNEPGRKIREGNLAIPAYDMSIESLTVKLAWLLAKVNKHKLDYGGLCREMINDIRGEVNVVRAI